MVSEFGHLPCDVVHVVAGFPAGGLGESCDVLEFAAVHPVTLCRWIAMDGQVTDFQMDGFAGGAGARGVHGSLARGARSPLHSLKTDGEFWEHTIEFALVEPDAMAPRADFHMKRRATLVQFCDKVLSVARACHVLP